MWNAAGGRCERRRGTGALPELQILIESAQIGDAYLLRPGLQHLDTTLGDRHHPSLRAPHCTCLSEVCQSPRDPVVEQALTTTG